MAKRVPSILVCGVVYLIFLVAVSGCNGLTAGSANSGPQTPALLMLPTSVLIVPTPAATAPPKGQAVAVASNMKGQTGAPGVAVSQRVVLKNAALTMTVDDPAISVGTITQMAEQIGGWVVGSNTAAVERNGQHLVQATISVRVPADQFATALERIKAGALSVETETITGDDVTQQFVDLSSQLSNLEATEAQLQKIMSTAANVNDVLTVQKQLTDVQGQIASIKGQLKYFSEAAAFSLISLTLNQKAIPRTAMPTLTSTPTATPKPLGLADWNPGQVAQSAADAVVSGAQAIASILIWLVIAGVPLSIPIVLIVVLMRRFGPRVTAK